MLFTVDMHAFKIGLPEPDVLEKVPTCSCISLSPSQGAVSFKLLSGWHGILQGPAPEDCLYLQLHATLQIMP